jgi:hypothetical protein
MSVSKLVKHILAIALVLTSLSPAVQASASPSEQRAVCSKSRIAVTPCTQTLTGSIGSAVTPTQRFVVSGLRDNISVALKGQSLPAGLRLNKQTGVISGVPSSTQVAKNFFLYISSGKDDKHTTESGLVAVVNITISGSTPPPTTYTVTATGDANGTVQSTPAGSTFNAGTNVTITFVASAGYVASTVTVDGTALTGTALTDALTSNSYVFTNLQANHTIAVTYTRITFTITPSAGSHGAISPSAVETVNSGSASSTYAFTPDAGYSVTSISIDGTDLTGTDLTTAISSGYTFNNVLTNHTISVAFVLNTFTVTASVSGNNGTISHSGVNTYNSGSNSDTFAFTPDAGYKVDAINVDGVALTGTDLSTAISSGYQFTGLTTNHIISVSFVVAGFTVTFDSNSALSGVNLHTQKQVSQVATALDGNTYSSLNGAHFYGWNTSANGSGTYYLAGETFPFTADTTLYAIWYFNITINTGYLDPGNATHAYAIFSYYAVGDNSGNRTTTAEIAANSTLTVKMIAYSNTYNPIQVTAPLYTPQYSVFTLTGISDPLNFGSMGTNMSTGDYGAFIYVGNPTQDATIAVYSMGY